MPNVLVTYTEHALTRMRERDIDQRLVEMTLAKPHRVFEDAEGKPIAERRFRSGTLRVVYVDRIDAVGWHRHVIAVIWR
jgi:hypothetical protein